MRSVFFNNKKTMADITSETKLTWRDIEKSVDVLAGKIEKDGFKADCIIGIAAGGIIPLGLLVKKMKIDRVLTVSTKSYEKKQQKELVISYLPEVDLKGLKVLLVDEIADTGTTLSGVSQALIEKCGVGELKTAVLVMNQKNCGILPDFFALSDDKWIVFPWEREEFPEYFEK